MIEAARRFLKVFLVEDSTLIRERLTESLSSSGRVEIVGHADDQSSAIAALHEAPCDAVVLDLDLKQGNGLEVLKSLRKDAGSANPWSSCSQTTLIRTIAPRACGSARIFSSTRRAISTGCAKSSKSSRYPAVLCRPESCAAVTSVDRVVRSAIACRIFKAVCLDGDWHAACCGSPGIFADRLRPTR